MSGTVDSIRSRTPSSRRFITPCSLADEKRSFHKLRQITDRVMPFNYRMTDEDIRRVAQGVLKQFTESSATTWNAFFKSFEQRLKQDYQEHKLWFEQEHTQGEKCCEFSAPAPGLQISCELPQSGIVGWGFVYFLEDNSRNSDQIKIGYAARDPVKRARTLLTGTTGNLCMVAMVNAPASFEKLLHRRYRDHRGRGEWFSYSCGWDEFRDDDYKRDQLRNQILCDAVLNESRSAVFTADEYHGWLLLNGQLNPPKETPSPR